MAESETVRVDVWPTFEADAHGRPARFVGWAVTRRVGLAVFRDEHEGDSASYAEAERLANRVACQYGCSVVLHFAWPERDERPEFRTYYDAQGREHEEY